MDVSCDDVGMNGLQALQYMTDAHTVPRSGVGRVWGHASLHIYQMPHPGTLTYQVTALGHMGLKIKWKLLATFKGEFL